MNEWITFVHVRWTCCVHLMQELHYPHDTLPWITKKKSYKINLDTGTGSGLYSLRMSVCLLVRKKGSQVLHIKWINFKILRLFVLKKHWAKKCSVSGCVHKIKVLKNHRRPTDQKQRKTFWCTSGKKELSFFIICCCCCGSCFCCCWLLGEERLLLLLCVCRLSSILFYYFSFLQLQFKQ